MAILSSVLEKKTSCSLLSSHRHRDGFASWNERGGGGKTTGRRAEEEKEERGQVERRRRRGNCLSHFKMFSQQLWEARRRERGERGQCDVCVSFLSSWRASCYSTSSSSSSFYLSPSLSLPFFCFDFPPSRSYTSSASPLCYSTLSFSSLDRYRIPHFHTVARGYPSLLPVSVLPTGPMGSALAQILASYWPALPPQRRRASLARARAKQKGDDLC